MHLTGLCCYPHNNLDGCESWVLGVAMVNHKRTVRLEMWKVECQDVEVGIFAKR